MAVKKEPEVKETVEVIDTPEKSYEDKIAELMAAAEERANAVIEKAEKAAEEIVKKATKATDMQTMCSLLSTVRTVL